MCIRDAHQGEYVAAKDARLAWLTGFTGSAGFCAALMDCAGVFVDGRYRVQVKQQVDCCFSPVDWPETDLSDWVDRAKIFYETLGAKIGRKPVVIKWHWGGKTRVGHLKDKTSYEKYQGHEYQKILMEELTQIPSELSLIHH